MKRKAFIGSAIASLLPLAAMAATESPVSDRKGFVTRAGEGRKHGHIRLKGVNVNILDTKISGTDTNGALAVFEQTSLSPGRGTPLHIHPLQDELFYVLEGSYYFKVGDDTFSLNAGDSIFLPRAVPHAWTQIAPKGRMVVMFQPAGKMEDFFVAMAGLDHEPAPAEIARLFEENEMKVVGPPLKLE